MVAKDFSIVSVVVGVSPVGLLVVPQLCERIEPRPETVEVMVPRIHLV